MIVCDSLFMLFLFSLSILLRFDATRDALISSMALTNSFSTPINASGYCSMAFLASYIVTSETHGQAHKVGRSTCYSCWVQTVAPSILWRPQETGRTVQGTKDPFQQQ
jgi:hypothetical protein